jgi:hypothetical protein
MADTPWCGATGDKLYLTSGQFTSTLKDSEAVGVVDNVPVGISYDGTNSPWNGSQADKLYLTSGQFTSTLKDSEAVGGIETSLNGMSWDGTNTPWSGFAGGKLYLQSGQFTSTLKTSQSISAVDIGVSSVSYDGTNSPWSGNNGDKLYLTSGQFTSTLITSESIGGIQSGINGISWDGTNTPWTGNGPQRLYLTSGQFTSTLLTSQSISAVDTNPTGIDTNDVDARLGIAPDADIVATAQAITLVLPAPTIDIAVNSTISLSTLAISSALPVPVVTLDFTVLISSPLSLSMAHAVLASVLTSQTVIISAPLSLFMAQQSPLTAWDTKITASAPLGLTGALPIPSQHGDANIAISAALALTTQIFTLSILIDADLFIIIVPDEALELGSANPSPLITIHADVEVVPLSLSMDISLLPLTFVIETDISISLPVLPLSFATNAVVVITDTFILLPGVPLTPLPMVLSAHAPEVSITDDVKIIVTNARTFAISEYAAMAFNSMAKFNGKYLYAKADGIYEGGGDNDNGTDIEASYKTGAFDINATEVQKLRNAFLNFRSNGDIQLFSVGNEINARLYNITNSTADTMHERRQKFERGIRDNHFSFGISNVAGSSFEIKSAKILTEPIRKRR